MSALLIVPLTIWFFAALSAAEPSPVKAKKAPNAKATATVRIMRRLLGQFQANSENRFRTSLLMTVGRLIKHRGCPKVSDQDASQPPPQSPCQLVPPLPPAGLAIAFLQRDAAAALQFVTTNGGYRPGHGTGADHSHEFQVNPQAA